MAFKVDVGMTLGTAYANGMLMDRIGRHVLSVIAGVGMHFLGPRGPNYLLGGLASTIVAYFVMMLFGMTLEMAREMSFFWGAKEVMMPHHMGKGQRPLFGFGPPMPFSLLSMEAWNAICWLAFMNGLHSVIAMLVIYQKKAKAMPHRPAAGSTMVVVFAGWFDPCRPSVCTIPA